MRVRATRRWMTGAAAAVLSVVMVGCAGAHGHAETAAGAPRGRQPVDLLPQGAIGYMQLDLDALRASPYADRVVGWYRQFAPAIPEFDESEPPVQLFEQVMARTHGVAAALYAPASVTKGTAATPLGADEGVVVVARGDYDLAFVQGWADRLHVELARTELGGRAVLASPNPGGDQLMVTQLEPGLLAFVAGHLEDAQARLAAVVGRLDGGSDGLAEPGLVATARSLGLASAPFGVVGFMPRELAEELDQELVSEEVVAEGTFDGVRSFGFSIDPSDGLEIQTLAVTRGEAQAKKLAAEVDAANERYRDNGFVLLLGFDLWLEHTETEVEGPIARATIRVPDADLKVWFFHVEHLAAAAKAFFTSGALGQLFGMGAAMGPPEPEATAPDASSPTTPAGP